MGEPLARSPHQLPIYKASPFRARSRATSQQKHKVPKDGGGERSGTHNATRGLCEILESHPKQRARHTSGD